MRKLFLAFIAIIPLLYFTGCEDNLDEHLDEYKTLLYFRNSGDQPVQLYSVNDQSVYEIVVIKAGSDMTTTPTAYIRTMNDAQLTIYNSENFTEYVPLPADHYSLSATQLEFSSEEMSKVVEVTLDISKIKLLGDGTDYVIPLVLESDTDKITEEKSILIIKTETLIPKISLGRSTEGITLNEESPATTTVALPVNMEIDNEWNLTCGVTLDATLVADFNAANSTNFAVLPANSYTLGTATFAPGSSTADISISITKASLTMGERYALGLRLSDVSNTSFAIDDKANEYLLFVTYTSGAEDVFVKVPLDDTMVTLNSSPGNEVGSISVMFDGTNDGYYQSSWAGTVDGSRVWIQVELPSVVNKGYYWFTGVYGTTANIPYEGFPSEMRVQVSLDGSTWRDAYGGQTLKPDMPTGDFPEFESPVIEDLVGYKFIRMTAERTFKTESPNNNGYDNFVAFAQFEVWVVEP